MRIILGHIPSRIVICTLLNPFPGCSPSWGWVVVVVLTKKKTVMFRYCDGVSSVSVRDDTNLETVRFERDFNAFLETPNREFTSKFIRPIVFFKSIYCLTPCTISSCCVLA